MKNIPVKNYFILLIMLIGVIIVTFVGKNYYNNNLKKVNSYINMLIILIEMN